MNKFRFIDLFAGIGGFHQAATAMGGSCVFASEIDADAKKAYITNFGLLPDRDFTKVAVKDIQDHDLLCVGFPCQMFGIFYQQNASINR